jgi:hypothetical protein
MDQVTVPRATVEQVLGALEGGGDSWRLIGPAIDALRAALEQPEQPEQPVQEPVARVLQTVGQYHTGRFVAEVETVRRLRNGESLYTHPPQRPAEPEQVVPYTVWRQGFDAVRKYKENNHD